MRILITLMVFSLWTQAFSQTSTCGDPSPLCVQSFNYPLGSNIPLVAGNNYGCITPSTGGVPAVLGYYYATISSAGPITLNFTSDNNLSVAAWGPFPDLATAAGTCGSLPGPAACSSIINSNSESITISGQLGEVFLIFVEGLAPPAFVGQFRVSQSGQNSTSGQLACIGFGSETVSCPGNITLSDCMDEVPDAFETAFEFEAAGGDLSNLCTDRVAVVVTESDNGANGCAGSPRVIQRTYRFQDQCGNTAACSQQISFPILDGPLEIFCPPSDAPSQLVPCLEDLVVNVQDIVALNACGLELSFDIGEPVINDASLGITCDLTCLHFPITVMDECGRTAECTLSFTVFGNIPEFVFDESEIDEPCRLAPLDIECRDDVASTLENYLDTLSVFNTCGDRDELVLSTNFSPNNFVNVCDGDKFQAQEITITAVDECGRLNSCTTTINIIKTEGPLIGAEAQNRWVSCSENIDSIFQAFLADNGGAVAFDFCSPTTFTTNPADPQFFISCDGAEGLSIEFIASDLCGNTSSTTGVFKVINDVTPSVLVAPIDVVVECGDDMDAAFADFLANQAGATVTGCGDITFTTMPENPMVPMINDQCDDASIEVTFVGTDICDQMISVTATFTVVDTTMPTVSGGEDLDLECNSATNLDDINTYLSNNGNIMASDICTDLTVTNDFDPASLDVDCLNDMPITVTFTVTDACGNMTTQTQTITITDTTPPVFTSIPTAIDELPIAEDECSDVTITSTQTTNGGQTMITYTATDACGNETTITVTFGEIDNTPPVITFIPPMIGCDGFLDPNAIIATDDNGPVTIIVQTVSNTGSCDMGFVITFNVTATDAAGNSTVETVTFTIPPDNDPPVFTFVPENMTFFCSEEVIIPDAIAFDSCTNVTITCVETLNAGAVVDNCNNGFGYDIFKVFTATDSCGNMATAIVEAWVVPDDYTAPRFEFVPESRVIECGEDAAFGDAICTSACGDVVLTFVDEITQGDCTQTGEMIRTWTGIDDCGNATTAQQIITIPPDTEAPIFTFIPESKTIKNMEEMVSNAPLCEDNCATINHLDINYTDEPLTDGCGITRTWVVADMCGNAAEANQTFFFDDSEAPAFSDVPEVIELNCGSTAEFSTPEITDNMGEVEVAVYDQESEDNCTGLPMRARTWTAIDVCGNVSSFTQMILTTDQAAPIFAAMSSDIVVSCNDEIEFDQAIASDNCSNIQSLDYVDVDLSDDNCPSCIYKVQRTWTAIDACGNEASISQTVTMLDQESPSLTIAGDAIANYDCGQALDIEMPTAFDNCSEVTITFTDVADESKCSNAESFTRTWIAMDAIGNQSTATQVFVYTDNDAPVFDSETPFYIESICDQMFDFFLPPVTDACSDVEITHTDQSFDTDCGAGAKLTRTWTATDACGNASEFTQTIEMIDNEAPVFDTLTPTHIESDCGEHFDFITPTVIDACSEVVILFSDQSFDTDCGDDTRLTRTWTATDACGNASEFTQTIELTDNEGPIILGVVDDVVLSCGEEIPDAQGNIIVAVDNCDPNVDILFDEVAHTEVNCSEDPILTRTYTAFDDCGNSSVMSYDIFREADTEHPVLINTIEDKEIFCGQEVEFDTPSFEDNCAATVDFTFVTDTKDDACSASLTRTWTASDNCGNATEVSQRIFWTDAEGPEILMPLASLEMSIDEYLAFAANPTVDAQDGCTGIDHDATTVDIVESGDCEDFRVAYTYSFTDNCGNQSSIDFEVTVPDALPNFALDAPQEVSCGTVFTASALEVDLENNSIEWTLNDPSSTWEIVSTTDDQIEINPGDGSAELVLTATNKLGCSTTQTQTIECSLVNAVSQLTAIDQLELRPNPVVDILTVQFTSDELLDAEFIVYDLLGRVLIQQSQDIISGDNQIEVNAANLQQGTYILEIATKKGSAVKKFMKF